MKRWLVLAVLLLAVTSLSAKGVVGPELTGLLAKTGNREMLPVNIILTAQADNAALETRCVNLTKDQRWELVVGELKNLSARSQVPMLAVLDQFAAQGKVTSVTSLWIVNGIYCKATPEAINAIAALDGINYVEHSLIYTKMPYCITPATYDKMVKGNVTVPTDALEWNVQLVGADSVWRQLGYTGQGVIVGHIDTGINYNHLDFAGHLWSDPNYPHNGWNFEDGTGDNIDIQGHGTHTAGTVCSNGTAGDTCGMAPRSQVMTCRVRTQADSTAEEQCFEAMQFCVAPPLNPTHHAQAITMSLGWVLAWAPRQATWRQAVGNVSTAGLPYAIAAGNERGSYPPPNDLRCPGNVPGPWKHPAEAAGGLGGCISIAATTAGDQIASFSSEGPVSWSSIPPYNDYAYPPGLIHPDVGAPGENITSTAYNNNSGYLSGWSGTSMATPCVAGTIALMLEKNPNLLPAQVDSILQMTVKPLGSQPKNNDFGTGRISAYRAVLATPLPNGVRLLKRSIDDVAGGNGDGIINPGETVNLPTWVINMDDNPYSGVTGKIAKRDTDALFAITDSVKSFGTVGAHDSASTGNDGFKIAASSQAADGHVMKIDLTCRDANDSTWVSTYDLTVGSAVFGYAGIVVHDSTGNNNGILDPGESANLVVLLHNAGLGNGYNVQSLLASGDARLVVSDPDGAYGTIFHDSTRGNYADPYAVTADPGIPPATPIACTLHVTADCGCNRTLVFTIRVGLPATPGVVLADHDTGYCKLTVSCLGSIGFDTPNTPQEGSGFCYPKSSATALYYGGMMAGNSASYVVDRHYGVPATAINTDWAIVDSLRFYPPTIGDEMIQGSYDDAAHPSPQGLKATQTSYQNAAPGYDDFVVMVFDYENTGSAAINGLYSGMIGDFDVGTSTADDAFTDAPRRAAYMNENGVNNPTVGFKLLSPTTASNLSVIDHDIWVYPDTSMSEGAKIGFMNGTFSVPQSNRSYDWSVITAAGPFDLPVGAHQRVAYAVVGGSDANSFLVNCDSAQSWYDGHVGVFTPPPDAGKLASLLSVTPNPLAGAACIRYAMPAAGRLSIKVFDINGREVASLIDGPVAAGAGTLTWTPRNIANGLYFVRAQVLDQKLVQKVMVVR
jgi:hypothetical protein